MSYPWKELSPKDPFMIRQTRFITEIDKKIITFLYQPIIGVQAYSLYMTMLAELEGGMFRSKELLHAELLALLGMGIPEFYQARIRLEGIGLLQTYVQEGTEKKYLYEPLPPLSSEEFFQEDLLRLLLLDHVGKRKLKELQERFQIDKISAANVEDITKSFLSVYHFSPAAYQQAEGLEKGEPSRAFVGKSQGKAPSVEGSDFNFKYLQELLQREFFSPEALNEEVKQSILALHQVYGIDEVEMSQHLLRATNLENGKVNATELTENVAEAYGKSHTRPGRRLTDKVEMVQQKSADEEAARKETLLQAGYSPQEISLILISEQKTPFSFITNIKKQKNGHVTEAERKLLAELSDKYHLSPAVLNILIYYVLVIQDNTRIQRNFAEAVADTWIQSNVTTPEQAIEKTKQFVGQIKAAEEKKNEKRANRYYGKNVVRKVEKLPDWAKEDHAPTNEEMMSEEMQRKFDERLKKIREKGKAGDE